MGAYIKNFKMPPPGKYRACVIVDAFGARLTVDVATSYADHDLRVDPIIPVPPHGRLIDADKLCLSSGFSTATEYGMGRSDQIEAIKSNAPTIIPAEEGEE